MLSSGSALPDSLVLAAEIATGKGILGQVALETGVPQSWVEIGLLVLLGYNVVAVGLSALQVLMRAFCMTRCLLPIRCVVSSGITQQALLSCLVLELYRSSAQRTT